MRQRRGVMRALPRTSSIHRGLRNKYSRKTVVVYVSVTQAEFEVLYGFVIQWVRGAHRGSGL